jgi:hypothetical protein
MEDLADEVHQMLDGPGPPGGPARPFALVQAQGAPDPLCLVGALNLVTL